jgi:hypothetical protein
MYSGSNEQYYCLGWNPRTADRYEYFWYCSCVSCDYAARYTLTDLCSQFGNMLVLAATYNSHLRKLIKKEKLLNLLDRTIDFLRRHTNISPTLKKDAEILTDVKTQLFATSVAKGGVYVLVCG